MRIGMGYSTEDQHLFNIRNSIYTVMYRRNGLQETSDIFWDAWQSQYKPETKHSKIFKRMLNL